MHDQLQCKFSNSDDDGDTLHISVGDQGSVSLSCWSPVISDMNIQNCWHSFMHTWVDEVMA